MAYLRTLCFCLFAVIGFDAFAFAPAVVAPQWSQPSARVSPLTFGHNTVWSRGGLGLWDEAAAIPKTTVLPLIEALRPGVLRFPGGTRAMRYHFAETIGPRSGRKPQCDPFTGKLDNTAYGLDEFLRMAEGLASEITLVSAWVDGSPEETAALVAYVNGSVDDKTVIGRDAVGVDWGTVSDWAKRRAENGHPTPYRVRYLEIGNEQYLEARLGPANSCGRPSRFRQDERWVDGHAIPTTARDYATQVALTAKLVRRIDPKLRIGASAYSTYDGRVSAADAVGQRESKEGSTDSWNRRLLADAQNDFDFFILHPYAVSATSGPPLAQMLRQTVHELKALAPEKSIGITEFGYLMNGGTLQDGLLTASVLQVAADERVELCLRHILIEDRPTGLFAKSAALLGPTHEKMPGYLVMQRFVDSLGGNWIPAPAPLPALAVTATLDPQTRALTAAFFPSAPETALPRAVTLELPAGNWQGEIRSLAGPSILAPLEKILFATEAAGPVTGALEIPLPEHGFVSVSLRPIP